MNVWQPIKVSSSRTYIKISSTDSGQTKLKCSSFQTGISVFVSLHFLVDKTSYPIVTLTDTFISPNVLVFLINSDVSNLNIRLSTLYYLKTAFNRIKPACFLSKLRKHLRFITWGSLGTLFPGEVYILLWLRAFKYGSKSNIP